jgi:CRISPR/Cas system CSM-associated protein Csm2 small subunit
VKKIFYEKVGRRYVPVQEYDDYLIDAFPKGAHLVMSYPGGTSRRYGVDPNYAAMIAAGRVAEDTMSRAIYQASEARPKERPITERQQAAWAEIKAAFGDEFFSLTLPAARDIAEAGVAAMQEEAVKLMQNDSVRRAFEQFQLVCELTKTQNR